jgi:hypothetical protein
VGKRWAVVLGAVVVAVGGLGVRHVLRTRSRLDAFREAVRAGPVRTSYTPFMVPTVELEAEAAPDGSLFISCDLSYEQLADYVDRPVPRVPPDGVRPGRATISFTDRDWDLVPERMCQPSRSEGCRDLRPTEDRGAFEVWSMALQVLSEHVAGAK